MTFSCLEGGALWPTVAEFSPLGFFRVTPPLDRLSIKTAEHTQTHRQTDNPRFSGPERSQYIQSMKMTQC